MSKEKRGEQEIAIVGMSIFSPAGDSIEEFWDGISKGKDFITDAPADVIEPYHFEGTPNSIDRFYCKRGGFSNAFKVDPLRYGILPVAANGIEPDQLISMAGVELALADAGVFEKNISMNKGSIIIGKGNFSGVVPLRSLEIIRMSRQFTTLLKSALPDLTDEDIEKVKEAYQNRQGRYQADMAIGTMPNLVASLVANKFDMHGPAYTIDAACASGIVAINHSIELLRSGECDIAVAGGMHGGQSAMFWGAFDMLGAMSHKGQSAPFSEDADGLLVGQGGGFIVLKTLDKAKADGDRIYSVIKETAISSDGAGTHVTVTSVEGQVRVLKKAWEKAGMNPEELGYIEAHGTATVVGDRTEIDTLKTFFGDKSHQLAYVGSVKSNIGHTMPAAGLIGVIKTALSLYHKQIPPTLHCEKPLPTMYDSRFMPPQNLIPWDKEKIPLVAGVNAFGFGGINAHAIMTAYEPEEGEKVPKKKPYLGEALMVSAKSKSAMIEKLTVGNYTNTGGDYRVILFEPTPERIEQTIAIVEKDKPWHGRMDIWFSNQSLLSKGGKLAFMYPGMNLDWNAEVDSLSDMLDLASFEDYLASVNIEERLVDTDFLKSAYIKNLSKQALDKLNVKPDLYLGHSVGEWDAVQVAGMANIDINRIGDMLNSWGELTNYPFVAAMNIDVKQAEEIIQGIPNLYLANDNCPSQVMLSGTPQAIEQLQARLDDEGIFYTLMPYGAGWHTPLIANDMNHHEDFLEHVEVTEGHAPVWSSTTLEKVPADKEAYNQLVSDQLLKPVYFRGLIDKLYQEENVRIFIQIGRGPLTNFVEDTLKGKVFGAIETTTNLRGGADQMRKVLALLFIEGREVDANFLGVKYMYQVDHDLLIIPRGAPTLITELPELTEAIAKRYKDGISSLGTINEGDVKTSISAMLHDNIRDAVSVQKEMAKLFEEGGHLKDGTDGYQLKRQIPQTAVSKRKYDVNLEPFEERISLSFEDHPYLVDHSIVRQPKWWDCQEDLNLVVPFTMTLELLSEIAKKRMPNRKLVKIGNVSAYQWISVEETFNDKVKGSWLSSDVLVLELGKHAKAEFTFSDEWPNQPKEYTDSIDIGTDIMKPYTSEEFYDLFSFHGPKYHSAIETLRVASKGILTIAEQKEGKGSLLDIMGQQLGLFLHLTAKENTISFPVRMKEMVLYNDLFDQKGIFEHTLQITRMTESVIVGNMILKRDGKVWSVAKDFVCQRFENNLPVWYVILKPQKNLLSQEIAPGVFMFENGSQDNILALLSKRYLNYQDREILDGLKSPKLERQYLISRIALKDAVRHYAAADKKSMIYPIEIFSDHDDFGRPLVSSHNLSQDSLDDLYVSLAHKDDIAVAMVGESAVGVDIERIEVKTSSFISAAFTDEERLLLDQEDNQIEAVIRFWVAKEASAKKVGTGFRGSPKQFVVNQVIGDKIFVNDDCVKVSTIEGKYVMGWTI